MKYHFIFHFPAHQQVRRSHDRALAYGADGLTGSRRLYLLSSDFFVNGEKAGARSAIGAMYDRADPAAPIRRVLW